MHQHRSPENWFVLQTLVGKEKKMKDSIDRVGEFSIPTYLPQKKMYHTYKGEFQVVTKVLFPGYVFVQKEIEKLLAIGKTPLISEKIRPVMFHDSPATVKASEMLNIFFMADDNGVIELSEVHWEEGENVAIISGPLKDIEGEIVFIDKRKRKAKVMVRLLNRLVPMTLGFQILERKK
ncbi:MAG: hypothetical protein CSA33_05990 [Desulfobulbus propionicus]|nr:MAG: hypothetical protein CSA33_05990 [Desulfobulbus propionicus]